MFPERLKILYFIIHSYKIIGALFQSVWKIFKVCCNFDGHCTGTIGCFW